MPEQNSAYGVMRANPYSYSGGTQRGRDTPAYLSPIDKTIFPPPNRPLNFPNGPHPAPLWPPNPPNSQHPHLQIRCPLVTSAQPSSEPKKIGIVTVDEYLVNARGSARRSGTGCAGKPGPLGRRNAGRDSRRQGMMVTGRGTGTVAWCMIWCPSWS